METFSRPMSKRQRDELQGYIAPGPAIFRAALFIAAIAVVALILRAAHRQFLGAALESSLVWVIPSAAVAYGLYRASGRWTGGPALREAVRRDLARGEVAVHRIRAVDAVAIDEQEDEGPAWFILDDTGVAILFAGQFLEPAKRTGFPWTTIEVVEAPASRLFVRIESAGEPIEPSVRHASFPWQELERVVTLPRQWGVVPVDFEALKQGRVRASAGP